MKILVAMIAFALSLGSAGAAWTPDERLLDAVCQIESAGGRFLYGDDGVSLGHFQMQKAAWTDVSTWRKRRGLPIYEYRPHVLNPSISRIYAGDYLTIIHDRLERLYDREPRPGEIYAAYNMGMGNFRKCKYDLAHVNKVTFKRCQNLETMLNQASIRSESR